MKYLSISLLCFLSYTIALAQISCLGTGDGGNCSTELSVTIHNSYSGSIAWASGNNFVTSGKQLWTNQTQLNATITATTTSEFTSSGVVAFFQGTGFGTSGYHITQQITLNSGDGNKTRRVRFLKELEPYESNHLNVTLDTTAPSSPELQGPAINELLQSTNIQLQRGPSYDTGIGLSHYIVFLSLSPDLSTALAFQVSSNQLTLLSSQLPLGTLYRKVDSVDFLGNTSSSSIYYFHNQAPSIPANNNSNKSSHNLFLGYSKVTEIIAKNGDISKNLKSTMLELKNGNFYWLDEDRYDGNHSINTNIIRDIMLEQFHSSPGSNERLLPKTLPKTGSWGREIMKQIDPCWYHQCQKKSYVFEQFGLLLFLFALLGNILQKNYKKNLTNIIFLLIFV